MSQRSPPLHLLGVEQLHHSWKVFLTELSKDEALIPDDDRQRRWLQLAITTDEEHALGEGQIFPTDEPAMVDYAYAVGAEHRGMRLASRAVMATLPLGSIRGLLDGTHPRSAGQGRKRKVARDAGFTLTTAPLISFEARGYIYEQVTWLKELGTD